jgi:RNA recognition motif-containing protein
VSFLLLGQMSEVPFVGEVSEKKRISVFNLPAGVTRQDDLLQLCKPFGSIVQVEFVPARGTKPAFGFVTYKTQADAEFAIYRLNSTCLKCQNFDLIV